MIERQFIKEKLREYQVKKHIDSVVSGAGHSSTSIMRTPLGDKVIISAAKPGLVVGRKGENIRSMTSSLKKKFNLENPQLEIEEITSPDTVASVVAERIVRNFERFGTQRFKRVAHTSLEKAIGAGALGIEILISGRIPGSRAKTWRFWQGYMKKSGSVSQRNVDKCITFARLKIGAVGVVVKILTSDVRLPDDVLFYGDEASLKTKSALEIKNIGGGREEEEAEEIVDIDPDAMNDELSEETETSEETVVSEEESKETSVVADPEEETQEDNK
jgi:small subunit ribosomal protein S3